MAVTWKLAPGKTWTKKLEEDHPSHGKIVPIPPRMRKRFGTGTMLIASPREVDALVRNVRKGRLVTAAAIRDRLAANAGADQTCPLTTGIFLRIVAEAAEERARQGRRSITPYWRVVRDNGQLFDKFPGGPRAQAARLRKEGLRIRRGSGKAAPRVEEFEQHLIAL